MMACALHTLCSILGLEVIMNGIREGIPSACILRAGGIGLLDIIFTPEPCVLVHRIKR